MPSTGHGRMAGPAFGPRSGGDRAGAEDGPQPPEASNRSNFGW